MDLVERTQQTLSAQETAARKASREAAALLALATTYWPNITRGTDPAAMKNAWAQALDGIPAEAAQKGLADLAKTLKFPPTVAEVIEASKLYIPRKYDLFDVLWAESFPDLGLPIPTWYADACKQLGHKPIAER